MTFAAGWLRTSWPVPRPAKKRTARRVAELSGRLDQIQH
jgi:hypothetical protein